MGKKWRRMPGGNIHRTFFTQDLAYFCRGLERCYSKWGTLEALFASTPDLWTGISLFREEIAAANKGAYSKHIANPAAGSASKRLFLALRWLVRRDGPVDLGLWRSIPPSRLFIPLDLHVGRAARELGLIAPTRKANNRKTAEEITAVLRAFCPEDPVKYDLALFSLSINGQID
jgi:uncharacterized protein (TIGR02757 family)